MFRPKKEKTGKDLGKLNPARIPGGMTGPLIMSVDPAPGTMPRLPHDRYNRSGGCIFIITIETVTWELSPWPMKAGNIHEGRG